MGVGWVAEMLFILGKCGENKNIYKLSAIFFFIAPPLTFSPLLSSNLFLPLHLAVLVLCEMLGCGFLSDLKLHFNSLICEILDFADSSLSVYIWVPFIQVSQCDQCFTVWPSVVNFTSLWFLFVQAIEKCIIWHTVKKKC